MKKHIKQFILITIIVVVLDQLAKYLIPTTVMNTAAAFGLLQGQQIFLILFSIIFVGAVIYFYPKVPKQKFPQIMTALILGGAIGNLIDRLLLGFVRDFIDVGFWPAFNIADSAITIGAIGLIIYLWKK
jgi:signal peptidase II